MSVAAGEGMGALPLGPLTLTAHLPPLFQALPDDEAGNRLSVSFGEMEVETDLAGSPMVIFVSVRFPASVGALGNQILIVPTDDPAEITLEAEVVVEPDVPDAEALMAGIEDVLRMTAVSMLFGDGLMFDVPGFDFGAIDLPGMGDASFVLTDPEVTLDGPLGEHVTVRADLRPGESPEALE